MAGLRRDIAVIAAFYAPELSRAHADRATVAALRPSLLDRLRSRARRDQATDGAPT